MSSSATPDLAGSIPALITPFRPNDEALDEPTLAALARRCVDAGSTGVVVCGSTGEAAAMTPAEQQRAIRTVVEAVGLSVPVIAGVSATCTREAIECARAAEACGAHYLLCAAPPYSKPTQEGLFAHISAVAGACGLPMVLYDVPSRVCVGFADETIARLVDAGVIHAVKDATADLARPARLRHLFGSQLLQLSGDDATAAAHLAMGGAGCISVSANVAPGLCAAMQRAWAGQDLARFAELRDLLAPLHEALFVETNPIPIKTALALLGLCDSSPRLPLTGAGSALRQRLQRLLSDYDLFCDCPV